MTLDALGGYRLVRKLGEGPRAEVFLGQLRSEVESRPVAVKVFRPEVGDASIAAEIEALARAAGEHVLPLRDVTTAEDGAHALILERIPGVSLGRLLRQRSRLELGEAITILAPIMLALARLHERGAIHGAVRADAVSFDGSGAPVLCCFGRAFPIAPGQPPALLDAVPGIALEIRASAAMAGSVLAAVDNPSARALGDWVDGGPALERATWFAEFADRLFDSGLPAPVDLTAQDPVLPVSAVPGRVVRAAAPVDELPPAPAALPGLLARMVPAEAADVARRVLSALRAVRPRLWLVAGGVAAALIAAAVLVPQGGSGAAARSSPTPVPPTQVVGTGPESAVMGDDPVAAVVALLQARERCIRDLSVLCLDDVAQQGSAALAADRAVIQSLQDGVGTPPSFAVAAAQVTIDERLGDSAILSLAGVAETEPASLLLMKGEAGWRIRDYLEE